MCSTHAESFFVRNSQKEGMAVHLEGDLVDQTRISELLPSARPTLRVGLLMLVGNNRKAVRLSISPIGKQKR